MKVIIKKTNEIKEVKDGYGRNFLLPKGLAVLATSAAIARIEQEKKEKEKKAQELAEKLDDLVLEMPVRVGKTKKLFGAITAQKIVDKLKEKGFEINKKQVLLEEPIKKPGQFKIMIDLGRGVKSQLCLHVGRGHQNV